MVALGGGGLLLVGVAAFALLALTGGDDDATPADDATPVPAVTAAEALPNLVDLGFRLQDQGKDPLVGAEQDMARAIYGPTSGRNRQVLMRVYFADSEAEAFELFGKIAQAYAVMPVQALLAQDPTEASPDLPGGPANVSSDSGPALGDEQAWYETTQPDSEGKAVWTDIYILGRAVVAIQLLDLETADSLAARTEIARRVLAKAPH
ncbi:MAG: hypothetical protein WEC33_05690 [Dehalococcoidia bacterium]